MKLSICLVVVLSAITVQGKKSKNQSKEIIGNWVDTMEGMKNGINEGIDEILDDSTSSGFNPEIDSFLSDEIKDSLCFNATEQCTQSKYFGCSCTTAFQQLGEECSQIPCKLWRFVFTRLSGILREFRDEVYSVEDGVELFVDQIYEPLMEMLCECNPEIHDATFQCIENYDGDILKESGSDAIYRMVVSSLDLESLKNVIVAMSDGHCANVGGEKCYEVFGNGFVTWGEMFDNTFDDSYSDECGDPCKSFRRTGREFARYISVTYTEAEEVGKNQFRKSIYAYVALGKKLICSPRCQESIANDFYSCCSANALTIAKEADFLPNMRRVAENLYNLATMAGDDSGSAVQFDSQALKKLLSMFDYAKFCKSLPGRQPNFYQKINDQCEIDSEYYEY